MTCRVLVADPPWRHGDQLPGKKRGGDAHYSPKGNADGRGTLATRDICRFPLPVIADVAHLFLWRVASMVPDAMAVCEAWGFDSKSELVWRKLTKHGKPHFGMGRQVRLGHEVCIIATRGRARAIDRGVRSVFDAPVPTDANGRPIHSAKPDEFYALVERLCGSPADGSHVELFARRERDGWLTYGNQLAQSYPQEAA